MLTVIVDTWAWSSALVTNLVLLAMTVLARRRAAPRARTVDARPLVTLVRPFRGTEDGSLLKHQSLVRQRYRPIDIRFVCTDPWDPGLPAARAACAAEPAIASCHVARIHGDAASDKARSMIDSWHTSSSPFVAFCDSDIVLHPDALAECMALFDERVGAVFAHCLNESPGPLGRLSMLTLTADAYAFLMGSARLGLVPFLEGGLMIVRRQAVTRAGGIEMVANAIGDDTRLGRRIRRAGFRLRLADFVIVHHTAAGSPREWLARYRRWLTCHRTEAPIGFWAELILNPTVAPLMAVAAIPHSKSRALLAAISIGLRIVNTALIDRTLLRRHAVHLGAWSLARPVADVLHMAMCVSVVLHPRVVWRNIRYRVDRNGNIARAGAPRATTPLAIAQPTTANAIAMDHGPP